MPGLICILQIQHCTAGSLVAMLADLTELLARLAGDGSLITISRAEYALLREKVAALSLEADDIARRLRELADSLQSNQ